MSEYGERGCPQGLRSWLISLQFVRWQIVTVVDIIIEVVLVFLAAILVHDLKMPITRKAAVVTAFFFRLPYVYVPPISLPRRMF